MSKQQTEKHEAQPLEIDDDELIEVLTNYERGGLAIVDEDPSKRYFFAVDDPNDHVRPDCVDRVKQLGYVVSENHHNSQDCVLMEISRKRWERMQQLKHRDRIRARKNKAKTIKREIGRHLVDLRNIDQDSGDDWS